MSLDTVLVVIFVLFLAYFLIKGRKYKLPPGPVGLPVLGYLPFMGKDPVTEFQKLSGKYGDVFSVYLGRRLVVVVTDAATAKQILNNPTVLDRPEDVFIFLPGGAGFGDRNGAEWAEQRRFTMMQMKNLGFGRSHWEKLVEMEVKDFLEILEESGGQPIDIYSEVSASISNNLLSLVFSQRLPAGHPKRVTIDKGIDAFEGIYDQSGLISNFPKLFKIFVEIGLIDARQKMKDMEDMSKCIRQVIEELKKDKHGESYVHKYIAETEKNQEQNLKNYFNDRNLLGNVQSLILAGSDTTKVSLLWLILAMASHPDIQDKVQKEIDSVLGQDGKADWSDRHKLPYCLATINEGQRWRTIAPLNVVRRTSEDMQIKGYDIPKRTHIITTFSAYHNDPKYWMNPEEFQPQRFLSQDGKTVTEPSEGYIPFSSGKRMCPAKTVALIELFYYFVAIMQKFRILPASDGTTIDLEGISGGLTFHPKEQPLRFIPRLI